MNVNMYTHSIHVHADDETCTINSEGEPGQFVIFSKDCTQRVFINLDESLRLQLIYTLMTQQERDETEWGSPP